MSRVVSTGFYGSPLVHKDRAPCLDARHSSVSPAKKNSSWRRSPTPTLPHKREHFAAASFCAVFSRTAPPIGMWPKNSPAIPARWASGGHVSPPNASMAWPTFLAAVLRGLFPPEDRHKVVVLATT